MKAFKDWLEEKHPEFIAEGDRLRAFGSMLAGVPAGVAAGLLSGGNPLIAGAVGYGLPKIAGMLYDRSKPKRMKKK